MALIILLIIAVPPPLTVSRLAASGCLSVDMPNYVLRLVSQRLREKGGSLIKVGNLKTTYKCLGGFASLYSTQGNYNERTGAKKKCIG